MNSLKSLLSLTNSGKWFKLGCLDTSARAKHLKVRFGHRRRGLIIRLSSASGCEWLTCLQKHFSPVQVLHFIAVVLRVRGAGPSAARLGPVNFSETFCMQLQRVDLTLRREIEHNLPWDNISTAEHRRTVHLRRIKHYVELFQLIENHLWSCKSFPKCSPLKYVAFRRVKSNKEREGAVQVQGSCSSFSFKTKLKLCMFLARPLTRVGGLTDFYYVRPMAGIAACS